MSSDRSPRAPFARDRTEASPRFRRPGAVATIAVVPRQCFSYASPSGPAKVEG
jgi:hypothetical protein